MIVTTFERGPLLLRSLRRLAELTPPDEIIVVDDGSDTDEVREAAEQAPMPVTYVRNDNPGLTNCCHARNVALRLAVHDDVLVTEPELIFLTDVVAQMTTARRLHPEDVLHEQTCYHEPRGGLGFPHDPLMGLGACDEVPGFYVHLMKRAWLLEIGGWDEDMPGPWAWEDLLLYRRLEHNGHPRRPLPEVRVRHAWHPSRIEPAVENEAYVRSRVFPRDLVANQGRDWGRAL